MIIHQLKIEENYLSNLLNGTKKAEIRLNDRDYQTGDILKYANYDHFEFFKITHVHSGLGLNNNYVCLSITKIDEPKKS